MPSGIAIDGTNVKTGVPQHTVGCMLLDACINSNYVLQQKLPDGTYSPVYNISSSSTPAIVTFLKTLQRTADVYAKVTGILDASGSLKVVQIVDAYVVSNVTLHPFYPCHLIFLFTPPLFRALLVALRQA